MEAGKLREDIVSPLLKISTYKVRRVYSSQSISAGAGIANDGDHSFTQLNFRLLGTSPASMLNARVRLVVPLRFYYAISEVIGDNAPVNEDAWDLISVGPRRNGLLKSFSTS